MKMAEGEVVQDRLGASKWLPRSAPEGVGAP